MYRKCMTECIVMIAVQSISILCGLIPLLFSRWNHDGSFFARMSPDTLSIYETPVSMNLCAAKAYVKVSTFSQTNSNS